MEFYLIKNPIEKLTEPQRCVPTLRFPEPIALQYCNALLLSPILSVLLRWYMELHQMSTALVEMVNEQILHLKSDRNIIPIYPPLCPLLKSIRLRLHLFATYRWCMLTWYDFWRRTSSLPTLGTCTISSWPTIGSHQKHISSNCKERVQLYHDAAGAGAHLSRQPTMACRQRFNWYTRLP